MSNSPHGNITLNPHVSRNIMHPLSTFTHAQVILQSFRVRCWRPLVGAPFFHGACSFRRKVHWGQAHNVQSCRGHALHITLCRSQIVKGSARSCSSGGGAGPGREKADKDPSLWQMLRQPQQPLVASQQRLTLSFYHELSFSFSCRCHATVDRLVCLTYHTSELLTVEWLRLAWEVDFELARRG